MPSSRAFHTPRGLRSSSSQGDSRWSCLQAARHNRSMKIDWDAPFRMDDGVVLRADVFRPAGEGRHPVILSYGPYGKGLAFQEGYPANWARLTKAAPEVLEGSSNRYQVWELVDPEKRVPDGY